MTKVIADISMSLDGYVAGRDAGPDQGLGVGGEPIHDWAVAEESPVDAEILDTAVAATGAVVMGRRTFDIVDGPHGWSEDMGYGASHEPADAPPVFVVTHEVPEKVRLAGRFTFVTDGIGAAIARAAEAAGDRDVFIMGGASVIQQALAAGLVDELRVHLAPVLVGDGKRLFEDIATPPRLEPLEVTQAPRAAHLSYRVIN